MRVAICVVLVSIFAAAGPASATVAAERAVSYPIPAEMHSATAIQDAIRPSAAQQNGFAATAVDNKVRDADFARDVDVGPGAFDRRLASLDPTQIVYDRGQAPVTQAGLLDLRSGRLFPRAEERELPRQHARSAEDFMLMGFVALMLVVYQLRRKHRFLRPHPFTY